MCSLQRQMWRAEQLADRHSVPDASSMQITNAVYACRRFWHRQTVRQCSQCCVDRGGSIKSGLAHQHQPVLAAQGQLQGQQLPQALRA